MPDAMNTESLPPGQGLAGLVEGGVPQLGASHEANAGFGEARGGARDLEKARNKFRYKFPRGIAIPA